MSVISVENDTEFQQKLSDAGPKLVVAQMTASWYVIEHISKLLTKQLNFSLITSLVRSINEYYL